MGRKKIETLDKIEDRSKRMITANKRVKGLMKKAIELSKLCDLKVFL